MGIERIWFTNDTLSRVMRGVLTPLSYMYRSVVRARNALYDRGMFHTVPSAVRVISVGNISVGGTGKTPVAAALVRDLRAVGERPAIVMRGYGGDEPDVHRALNPAVRVYTCVDRASGIAQAANDGATVVVLDDAFQHRRAERHADIVLVSAERWRDGELVLPAGSLREPASSLKRATLIIVTAKIATPETVARVTDAVERVAPTVPVISVRLRANRLERADNAAPAVPLSALAGERVFAVAGIGDPESFFAQLEQSGALVTRVAFRDHHAYTAAEAAHLADRTAGHKYVISTLKDLVKLRGVWPPKGRALWYVSQAVEVTAERSSTPSPARGSADTILRHLPSF
jgi:tetraacyldisaccharide 4'-kinase